MPLVEEHARKELSASAVQDVEKTSCWLDISSSIHFSHFSLRDEMTSFGTLQRVFKNPTASDPDGGGSMLQSFINCLHFLSKQERIQ